MAQVSNRGAIVSASAAVVLAVVLHQAGRIAWRERQRSLESTMPRPMAAAPLPSASMTAAESGGRSGVLMRLTEEFGNAHLTAPNLREPKVMAILSAHWRKHKPPFVGPSGEQGRWVQTIGLERHSEAAPKAKDEENRPTTEADKLSAIRNTQTFGLGEGSFAEREAIVLPPPGQLRYRVQLPKNARFRFAPAVLGEGAVTFILRFKPAGAASSSVLFRHTETGPSRRWVDQVVSLDAATGAGELELATESNSLEPVIGLLGSPVVLAPAATKLPYNVLFIIVDALRGDAIAEAHDVADDERRARAKWRPYDAWIPRVDEIAPNLNGLARAGVIWENAWSAAMWTRPATIAMLSGQRASRLGLSVLALELMPEERRKFYASEPPMLPRYFRRAGAHTAAIVNNMYLCGSVGVGVDYAFETLVDHRYHALDTQYITNDALSYLSQHQDERFLLLLNYASPHSPYVPPRQHLDAIKKAKGLPEDPTVRNYLAEIHKDDAAIGQVLTRLGQLGLTRETLVIVTADHGETMSEAHDAVALDVAKGVRSGRFTHLSTMWEESARVALLMSLPGHLPAGLHAKERVQTLDLLPTILELEGIAVDKPLDGRSLVPQFTGKSLGNRRVVIEGRGARSILSDQYHLIVRERVAQRLRIGNKEVEKAFELYDLERDPGERRDIALEHPELVARLRRELAQELASSSAPTVATESARWHLRFATGGKRGRVEVSLFARGVGAKPSDLVVHSAELDARAIRRSGERVQVAFDTVPEDLVGLDVELRPAGAELGWAITLDGRPWPVERIYGGALGMRLAHADQGLAANLEPSLIESATIPHVAASHELGLFVTREPSSGPQEAEISAEAQVEAEQAMQAWGYARKPSKKTP